MCVHNISSRVWVAAHSVYDMFSLYFDYLHFYVLILSLDLGIWVLIASFLGLCHLFTFK